MSSVPRERRRPSSDEEDAKERDRFYYGVRYVERVDARGKSRVEEVPLTEEDLLFPEEGDQVMDNHPHALDCRYLADVFERCIRAVIGAVVLFNCRVAWGVRNIRPFGPDVAVVFGVAQRREWTTFDVAEEGVRPELVVEVTSPKTRNNDLVHKRRLYYRVGVPYYVIVNQLPGRGPRLLELIGLTRGSRGYRRLSPDARGWLWLETVGVWLAIEDGNRVVCYDRAGNRILRSTEMADALATAERSAADETVARIAAEARVRQLEEQLRLRNER